MNAVTIEDGRLVVVPRGLDRLWSFTRRLSIPVEHVRSATHDPSANREPKGLRAPGLSIPGKTAGTFRRHGRTTFWNISNPRDTVVVELVDERFDRLVITVADPAAVVDAIEVAAG